MVFPFEKLKIFSKKLVSVPLHVLTRALPSATCSTLKSLVWRQSCLNLFYIRVFAKVLGVHVKLEPVERDGVRHHVDPDNSLNGLNHFRVQ